FLQPILEGFNQLLFRMDSGFASPQIYNSIEESGESYLIKLKRIIPVVSDPMYTKGIEEYKKKNRHGKVAIFPFCEPQYNVKAL
ncbi:hypothetical protein HZZ02_24550, partial [Streptococcus danieliae]|nr:hypothetical protein [Streptococcus danieliae]